MTRPKRDADRARKALDVASRTIERLEKSDPNAARVLRIFARGYVDRALPVFKTGRPAHRPEEGAGEAVAFLVDVYGVKPSDAIRGLEPKARLRGEAVGGNLRRAYNRFRERARAPHPRIAAEWIASASPNAIAFVTELQKRHRKK